jgi:predicted transcriptional regulator
MGSVNISLPDDLTEELRRLVPARRRSAFIAEAIRERMALLRQIEAVRESAGTWSSEGRGNPSVEVQEQREGWSAREERIGAKG